MIVFWGGLAGWRGCLCIWAVGLLSGWLVGVVMG